MVKILRKLFFDPPSSIEPGLPELRARILSGLTFGFLVVDALLTIRGELTGGASFQVYVFGAIVLIVYIFSRTKFSKAGGIIWILSTSVMLLAFDFQAFKISPERLPQGIGFVSLPILLSLLLLPAIFTLWIAIFNFIGLGILIQQIGLPVDSIILPIVNAVFVSGIAIITAFILERDRQSLINSNDHLTLAYEATLEGWVKALELKDKDTERHSKKVIDYTIQISRIFGLSDEEISNVRRGALLHDIGKMAIPDHILRKTWNADQRGMGNHAAASCLCV